MAKNLLCSFIILDFVARRELRDSVFLLVFPPFPLLHSPFVFGLFIIFLLLLNLFHFLLSPPHPKIFFL